VNVPKKSAISSMAELPTLHVIGPNEKAEKSLKDLIIPASNNDLIDLNVASRRKSEPDMFGAFV
jgi:hypothetical protein